MAKEIEWRFKLKTITGEEWLHAKWALVCMHVYCPTYVTLLQDEIHEALLGTVVFPKFPPY